jgi:chemotaxis protein CheZ
MTGITEEAALKKELAGLFQYMQRVREEIAAIHYPADDQHRFEKMSDQLDAIVETTKSATDQIMQTVEQNEELLGELRDSLTDEDAIAKIDKISASNSGLFEACSFQDLTGQRISKVVKSLTYVEDRVESLIEAWGKAELEKIVVKSDEKSDDEKLLNGPQRQDEAISQSEIDALFD